MAYTGEVYAIHLFIMYIVQNLRPVEILPGQIYVWKCNVSCRDGSLLPAGSEVQVISITQDAPYGEIMERGYNLICKAANGTTVWATLEQCLSRDMLELKR